MVNDDDNQLMVNCGFGARWFGIRIRVPLRITIPFILTQPMDPEKKSLNFIFPTKYVIPKSLKFSHWLSKHFWGFQESKPPGPKTTINH